jgi:hypothetical protein
MLGFIKGLDPANDYTCCIRRYINVYVQPCCMIFHFKHCGQECTELGIKNFVCITKKMTITSYWALNIYYEK